MRLIDDYLIIERARFEERLNIEIHVPEELSGISVPSFILQPLVENAIKHAVSENISGGTITIKAHREDDGNILITITDSGPGKKAAISYEREGIGIKNVRERIASYYNGRADLRIEQKDNGTECTINIPRGESSPHSSAIRAAVQLNYEQDQSDHRR